MSLRCQWAMWAAFALMVRQRGFAEAYGWFYVSCRMTIQLNAALARGVLLRERE